MKINELTSSRAAQDVPSSAASFCQLDKDCKGEINCKLIHLIQESLTLKAVLYKSELQERSNALIVIHFRIY